MDGNYKCDITPNIAPKIKESCYSKSMDFVIEVMLLLESKN